MSDFILFTLGLLLGAGCAGWLLWLLVSRGFPIFDGMLDGLTYTEAREKAQLDREKDREKSLQELAELRNKNQ